MAINPEWITAIASCISCAALWLAYRQYLSDHERSRRENAVNLTMEWSRGLLPRAFICKKFVETLSPDHAKKLFLGEPFVVDNRFETLVTACLAGVDVSPTIDSHGVHLGVSEVVEIRRNVIAYLNLLDAILLAWRHNTADRGILEEEFVNLVKDENGQPLLRTFREAAGGHSTYPAIDEFVNHVIGVTIMPGRPPITPP